MTLHKEVGEGSGSTEGVSKCVSFDADQWVADTTLFMLHYHLYGSLDGEFQGWGCAKWMDGLEKPNDE